MERSAKALESAPGALEESLDSVRFPRRSPEYLATVVEVLGAEMRVDRIEREWENGPDLMSAGRVLPIKDEVRSSLWLDASEIARIRESVYECHDLRVVHCPPGGEPMYLATRRLEPRAESNVSTPISGSGDRTLHEVPINGCWWAPGGRIRAPKEGSALAERGFDRIDSVLLKLNEELGLSPDDVLSIRYLGQGETKFGREMEYRYECRDDEGEPHGFTLPVEMPLIQHTVNSNYVVVVKPDAQMEARTLCSASWITRDDYERHRSQFLAYEQEFIDAVFARL